MPDSVELLRFGRAELHVYLGMLILSCLSWHVYLYMLILLQCASSVSCQCLVSACQCLVSAERACLPSPVVCAQDDGIWMFRCISDVFLLEASNSPLSSPSSPKTCFGVLGILTQLSQNKVVPKINMSSFPTYFMKKKFSKLLRSFRGYCCNAWRCQPSSKGLEGSLCHCGQKVYSI